MKLRLAYTIIRCDDDEDDFHSITQPGDSEEARFIRGSRAFARTSSKLPPIIFNCVFGRILANMYILLNCNYALFEPILDAVSSTL